MPPSTFLYDNSASLEKNMRFCHLLIFLKINFFKNFSQVYHQCQIVWIQIRPNILQSLIFFVWFDSLCLNQQLQSCRDGQLTQPRSGPTFCQVWSFLFGLILYDSVNSYSHAEMVSSPNHTFCLGKLDLAVNQYLDCNWQQPFLNQQKEENDHKNYFMINLHQSMGPGRDQTRDPWIWCQTHTVRSDQGPNC